MILHALKKNSNKKFPLCSRTRFVFIQTVFKKKKNWINTTTNYHIWFFVEQESRLKGKLFQIQFMGSWCHLLVTNEKNNKTLMLAVLKTGGTPIVRGFAGYEILKG